MKSLPSACCAAVAALLLAGCASPPPYLPVNDMSTPVHGTGFTLLPPGGGDWLLTEDPAREAIAFGKPPRHAGTPDSTLIVVAARVKARQHDIQGADGLRMEVEEYVRVNQQRFRLIKLSVTAYPDAELATDCVRIDSLSEESNNPRYPGKTLSMSIYGKACRQPSSPSHFVQLTCSERWLADSAPQLDEALRRECDRSIDSLRFTPAR